jgi:hypothetical protein
MIDKDVKIMKAKRNKRSQAARNRAYQKQWDALVDEMLNREKEGKPIKKIRTRIMKLNKEYARG